MIRFLASIGLIAALGACQDGETAAPTRAATATLATQNVSNADDMRAAKPLFGAAQAGSRQSPAPLGFYSRGCQAGAVQLAETGPTWQAMRLSRNRNWAQPATVDFIQDLSRVAASLPGWEGLYVGDLSQPRGGPMLTGHASHQSGLDADIWMLPPQRLNLTVSERESISSIRMDRTRGAYVNGDWSPQHMALLKAAASDPRVARIFVFPGAKVAMCDAATGDRSWLGKVRPWYGHNYHFHVRLNCPAGAAGCEAQEAPPPGDGCDDARQWVSNILNPPPPDPNARPAPPKAEITMASLPGQCLGVLNAD